MRKIEGNIAVQVGRGICFRIEREEREVILNIWVRREREREREILSTSLPPRLQSFDLGITAAASRVVTSLALHQPPPPQPRPTSPTIMAKKFHCFSNDK